MPVEKYEPQGNSQPIEPLEAGQYPDCVLEKVYAFRQEQKDEDTGNTFMRTKLSLYWNSGYTLPDSDEPFYINDGFVTFSLHERSNLAKMLSALEFIKLGESAEIDYELGGNHQGLAFTDTPVYAGTGPKKDVEVPVESLKIDGRELVGTIATLIVSVTPKNYNKVEMVLKPGPKTPTKLGPRRTEAAPGKAEAPVRNTAQAAQSEPLWRTWRTRAQAVKWAATLKNNDGSLAYPSRNDAEQVWESLHPIFLQEVFEGTEQEFYWHWHRWHVTALHGGDFSFSDDPSPEDVEHVYAAKEIGKG